MIKEDDIIEGTMPTNNNEIVVDKKALENMMFSSNGEIKAAGYLNISMFLNKTASINGLKDYKIVGITNLESPSIYVNKDEFTTILSNNNETDGYYDPNLQTNLINYKLLENKITLTKGSLPVNDYEVIINENYKDEFKIGSNLDFKVNDINLKVVGYYHMNENNNNYLVNENTIKYNLINTNNNLMVYSKSKNDVLNKFKEMGLNANDSYIQSKEDYIANIKDSVKSKLVFSGIILVISLIEIFLIVRSSFLSRIKEVGVLRAIGLKKLDVYKMFTGEILAITILASTPGLLLMLYILKQLSNISFLSRMFVVNLPVVLISIIFILFFNIVFGLIPVFTTMRQTPAKILSRTDLE